MKSFSQISPELARECFAYDAETGDLTWMARPGPWSGSNTRWAGKVAGHVHTCTGGKRYIQVRVNGALHYAHRIAWVLANGPIPEGMQIDHVDGDGANNRLSNLRLVTAGENMRNMRLHKTNKSGCSGVFYDATLKRPWRARGYRNGKHQYLGIFATKEEAIAAREAFNAANDFHENHGTARPL